MRFLSLVAVALVAILSGGIALASADQNGYIAQYECRAGNPNCNVDVTALGKRTCDQIVSPSMPWSSINWSNSTICIETGNHTGKGSLIVPSWADGSGGAYKVLRYYRANDSGDDPWDQGSNQAKLSQLVVEGSYWLVHRLTFPMAGSPSPRVESAAGSSNHIFDRILVEGSGTSSSASVYGYSQDCNVSGYSNLTVQNSVFRHNGGQRNSEGIALNMQCADNLRAVNNEIYDWCSHPIQTGHNGHPTLAGLVIENNDLYISPVFHLSSGRSKTEGPLDLKAIGTSWSPVKIIHNRMWGSRTTDTNYCGNGGSGAAITVGSGIHQQLIQNNILFESKKGIVWAHDTVHNHSVIGNLIYSTHNYDGGSSSHGIEARSQDTTEHYLNTIIHATQYGFTTGDHGNTDYKCNVLIASGPNESSSPASGSIADHNVFYGTPAFGFNGSGSNIEISLKQRANSARYEAGNVIRIGQPDQCTGDDDPRCYLYKVVRSGVSASSMPSYCTSPNCTVNDGSVILAAIRGPYTFYRKLRTGPERYAVPYARPYVATENLAARPEEAYACPADFAARNGVGVNDDF